MVKIRLMRVGKRKQPSYRVVVADSRSPRDGRIIEAIGHYQPRQDPSVVEVDNERALYWLKQGAQPSGTVKQILRISGAWSAFSGEAPLAAPAPAPVPARPTVADSVTATAVTSADEQPAEEPPGDAAEEPVDAAAAPGTGAEEADAAAAEEIDTKP